MSLRDPFKRMTCQHATSVCPNPRHGTFLGPNKLLHKSHSADQVPEQSCCLAITHYSMSMACQTCPDDTRRKRKVKQHTSLSLYTYHWLSLMSQSYWVQSHLNVESGMQPWKPVLADVWSASSFQGKGAATHKAAPPFQLPELQWCCSKAQSLLPHIC